MCDQSNSKPQTTLETLTPNAASQLSLLELYGSQSGELTNPTPEDRVLWTLDLYARNGPPNHILTILGRHALAIAATLADPTEQDAER